MVKPRILVVDDEETIRKLLRGRLEREEYDVATAASADEAEFIFSSGGEVSVLVTDLKMPGKDGFGLMAWAKENSPRTRVLVITGHGEKEVAVQALRSGASDYLEKPFDLDELSHSVARCVKEYRLQSENQDLLSRLEARVERVEGKAEDRYWFVSKSRAMSKVNEWLSVLRREAMRGDAEEPTVLILGKSGTGKEGIARMVHAGSRRGRGPWVAVNCANFNEQLLESELFGHERGAFTGANATKRGLFEIARGGTLFLDEIGEMDVKLQAKLLRVFQEKVFRRVGGTADLVSDVRVIAATNQDLSRRVMEGKFREDLFHRLSRVVIELPTLRERTEDVLPMATQFTERAFHARGKKFVGFSHEAEQALLTYTWPGNVRELLNVVERAALVWTGHGKLGARALLLPEITAGEGGEPDGQPTGSRKSGPDWGKPSLKLLEEEPILNYTSLKKKWSDAFEREFLISALNRHDGNVSAAAREAKIDRSNFLRLLRRHRLSAAAFRSKIEDPNAAPAVAVVGQKDAA